MKKLIPLFFICAVVRLNAQSFYTNALVFDVNTGVEIYNTKAKVHNNISGKDTTTEDKTGNFHYTIGGEYGLHKNFGLGLRFKSGNYFVEKDTTGNGQETVKGMEFVLQANYHPVSSDKFDLVLGADAGYSQLKYNLADADHTKIWGKGMFYSFYVNPRIYFGRVGLNAKLYTPFFNYPKLQSNNESFNKDQSFKLSGIPGFGFNLGLQFRLLNERVKKEEKKKEEVQKQEGK